MSVSATIGLEFGSMSRGISAVDTLKRLMEHGWRIVNKGKVSRLIYQGGKTKMISWSKQNNPCLCCGTAVIYSDRKPPHNINISATCDELLNHYSNKEMIVIRGDCPLENRRIRGG